MGDHFRDDVQLTMKIFETVTTTILTYGGEVWGVDHDGKLENDPIEFVQTKFIRWLLGVNKFCLTTRGSCNQGSYNQGFLKQGILQPGVLKTTGLTIRGSYSQGFLQPRVLNPEILTTRGPTTRGSYC